MVVICDKILESTLLLLADLTTKMNTKQFIFLNAIAITFNQDL